MRLLKGIWDSWSFASSYAVYKSASFRQLTMTWHFKSLKFWPVGCADHIVRVPCHLWHQTFWTLFQAPRLNYILGCYLVKGGQFHKFINTKKTPWCQVNQIPTFPWFSPILSPNSLTVEIWSFSRFSPPSGSEPWQFRSSIFFLFFFTQQSNPLVMQLEVWAFSYSIGCHLIA